MAHMRGERRQDRAIVPSADVIGYTNRALEPDLLRHDFISDNIHLLYCTRLPLADLMGAMNGACCLSLTYALFLSLSTSECLASVP
jgi:hypothetical protein